MPAEPLIVAVLRHYFPEWEPPKDTGKEWALTLCPFHGDSNASASISLSLNAFACHACGEKGDAIGIIMRKEKLRYAAAVRHAEELSPGSGTPLPRKPGRKPRRRAFG